MNKIIGTCISLFGTAIIYAIGTNKIKNNLFDDQKKFLLEKRKGTFNNISIEEHHQGFIYTLSSKRDNNTIEEICFIIYASHNEMKGMTNLIINKNSDKNSFEFDFKKNYWDVYDSTYKNNIIINITKDTAIVKK
jgi:hypothetical protein